MYELVQLAEHSYYMESPAKVGIMRVSDTDVVAIDSGSDKDAGKKLKKLLDANGWRLTAVYNTHSHADHIGGNRYLQEQTACRIFVPGIDCDFTNHPILEPALLYGGDPLRDLKHKFLLAQESRAEELTQDALPDGMELIELPGHCFDMVGFRTADDVVYLADCLSSRETLDKYGVGYLWDVEAYLATLERVKTMQARCFVPAHAAPTEDIAPLAQYNIDAVTAIAEKIASLCAEPVTFEDLLQKLFRAYGMTMNLQQYVLIGSTLRSYLSYLEKRGQVTYTFENEQMLWRRA